MYRGMSWQDDALCVGMDPELFFPPAGRNPETKRAKEICKRCPVREECLDHALRSNCTTTGVWGATTQTDRRVLRRKLVQKKFR